MCDVVCVCGSNSVVVWGWVYVCSVWMVCGEDNGLQCILKIVWWCVCVD